MAFKAGDKVISPQYRDTVWQGEMTVREIYSVTGMVACNHPIAGKGAFPPSQLVLVEDVKVSVKDAIALLQAEGYRVEAPYWEAKQLISPRVSAWVNATDVQLDWPGVKQWINFADWDRITKVVEEAKEFNRKYRS